MSQEKMEKYKEYKKNRKEELAKEKQKKQRTKLIWTLAACVIALALVVSLCITGVNAVKKAQEAQPQYERTAVVISDIAGVLETEAAE